MYSIISLSLLVSQFCATKIRKVERKTKENQVFFVFLSLHKSRPLSRGSKFAETEYFSHL